MDKYPLKSFSNFRLTLCSKCACDVLDNLEDGIYFEYCDKCGKMYDPILDEEEFLDQHRDDEGAEFEQFGILCLDCANDAYDKFAAESYRLYKEYINDREVHN